LTELKEQQVMDAIPYEDIAKINLLLEDETKIDLGRKQINRVKQTTI